MASFFAKWLDDVRDAQTEAGSIPDVAPPFWEFYSDNMTWPSAYLIIPQWYYEHYADTRLLARHYPSMCRWMEYMSQFLDGHVMPRDRYGDWCVPPESPELIHSKAAERKTAGELLGTAYYYHNLKLLAVYATILGKTDDAERFTAEAAIIRDAFNDRFLNCGAWCYDNGTQTSSVLPLAFGLVPAAARDAVFANLVANIEDKCDGHLGTGLVGGQWLMRVLSDHGRPDVAFRLATQRTYPSWGYMVERGATTVWELWNGDSADPAMNSGNHLMLVGDLVIWMYEYLAGIRPDPEHPGFKRFRIAPICPPELEWARGEIASMHGRIRSAWWRADGRVHLAVTVPPNTHALVRVPTLGNTRPTITVDGTAVMHAGEPVEAHEHVRFAERDAKGAWFTVGSGTYRFEAGGDLP